MGVRLQTLRALAASITSYPTVASPAPTRVSISSSAQITGTFYPIRNASPTSGAIEPVTANYTLAGCEAISEGLHLAGYVRLVNSLAGNGSDPLTVDRYNNLNGQSLLFATSAPEFELFIRMGSTTDTSHHELWVDGHPVASYLTIPTNPAHNDTNSFVRIRWGDGSASNARRREYRLVINGFVAHVGGVQIPIGYTLEAGTPVGNLTGLLVGDSFCEFAMGKSIIDLLGQHDTFNASAGSTGFFNDASGTASDFVERTTAMLTRMTPDFVIDVGGINDGNLYGSTWNSPADYAVRYRQFVSALVAANPSVVIFATCSMSPSGPTNTNAAALAVKAGKQLVAAQNPRNLAVIDNLGENWVTGTRGLADGNAEWVTGSDNVHPTSAPGFPPAAETSGTYYLAQRVAAGVSAAIPALERANAERSSHNRRRARSLATNVYGVPPSGGRVRVFGI